MHDFLIGNKLANLLNGKINIELPNVDTITRIGALTKYENKNVKYTMEAAIQFVIATADEGKSWYCNEGPAININENAPLSFNEALDVLVNKIVKYANGNFVRFNLPVLPRISIEKCILEIEDKIVVRYIEDYLPMTDTMAYRFDVVVTKGSK